MTADLETAMMAVVLGRSRATGRFGNNKLPSLIVWFLSERSSYILPCRLLTEYRGPHSRRTELAGFSLRQLFLIHRYRSFSEVGEGKQRDEADLEVV